MKTAIYERSLIYKKIIRDTTGTLGLKVETTILNMCIAIILARLLGVVEYGQYTLVITIVGFISVSTTLGLPNLIDRLVIYCLVENNRTERIRISVVAEFAQQTSIHFLYKNTVYHAA